VGAAFRPQWLGSPAALWPPISIRTGEGVGRVPVVARRRVRDIDFLRCTVQVDEPLPTANGHIVSSIGKTSASTHPVTLPSFLVEMLAEHLAVTGRTQPEDHVFQAPRGGPLNMNNFRRRIWAPSVQQCGFDGLTPQGLRHSAAGLMRLVGAPDQVIQERMRHTHRPTTTDIYGWVPADADKAVVDRIDALFRSEDDTKMARETS
jgi:integrase